MKKDSSNEVAQISHPSQDRSGRFREDFIRRWAGFRIHSRRKGKAAVWEKEGVLYHEDEAYRIAHKRWEEATCAGK